MEKLVINIPEGYEINEFDKKTGTITFRPKSPEYPTDISKVSLKAPSYYIAQNWVVGVNPYAKGRSKTTAAFANLARQEDVEALIALAQLITLRDEYNRIDDFIPNFRDHFTKYYLFNNGSFVTVDVLYSVHKTFVFKSKETAELFLKNFEQLINTAKNLI